MAPKLILVMINDLPSFCYPFAMEFRQLHVYRPGLYVSTEYGDPTLGTGNPRVYPILDSSQQKVEGIKMVFPPGVVLGGGFEPDGIYYTNRDITVNGTPVAVRIGTSPTDPPPGKYIKVVLQNPPDVPPDFGAWKRYGHAYYTTGLAALGGQLYCATSENKLWRRPPVDTDINWTEIGDANGIKALAGDGDTLFGVDGNDTLLRLSATVRDGDWEVVDGAPAGTRALAAADGILYAVDGAGHVHLRPATAKPDSWKMLAKLGPASDVTAMTAWNGSLLASTASGRLLRTAGESIEASESWFDARDCEGCSGLAAIDNTLFAVTHGNALNALDLFGGK